MPQQADNNKRHIIIFALITALCLFGDSMLYIVLPVHSSEAGFTSLWQVGVILSVNRIVRLPLNPCIGWFYRHISERTGIIIAIVLATLTTVSYGFLQDFTFWILARCAWGVAWTLLRLGSLFCILRLSTQANRGHYTGLYNGLYRLGSLVGMFVGGLLADSVGLKVTGLVFGAATILALILAIVYIPRGSAEQAENTSGGGLLEGFSIIVRERGIFWMVLSGGVVALVIQGVIASTLSRLIGVHTGGDITFGAIVIGASTLGGFFQALRWGWEPWLAPYTGKLADTRFGWRLMYCYASAASALFFSSLALSLPLPLWFACILGMLLTATALTTIADMAASDTAASIGGGVGGRRLLMNYALMLDVGSAIGPLAAYGLNAVLGINAVYAACGMLLLGLCIFWRSHKEGT